MSFSCSFLLLLSFAMRSDFPQTFFSSNLYANPKVVNNFAWKISQVHWQVTCDCCCPATPPTLWHGWAWLGDSGSCQLSLNWHRNPVAARNCTRKYKQHAARCDWLRRWWHRRQRAATGATATGGQLLQGGNCSAHSLVSANTEYASQTSRQMLLISL